VVGDAVVQSLRHVWLELDRLGVPAAVAGGLAVSAWKHIRATRDIDLLISIGETDIEPLLERLRAAGLHAKKHPPIVALGQIDVVPLLYEPPEAFLEIQIDLLLARSEYYHEALGRRVTAQIPELEFPVAVLTCEDLILHKLLAGRLIDRADAVELLRIHAASIDSHYLVEWIERLDLRKEFAEVWSAALPGKPLPTKP
jgi:hypothetical protein